MKNNRKNRKLNAIRLKNQWIEGDQRPLIINGKDYTIYFDDDNKAALKYLTRQVSIKRAKKLGLRQFNKIHKFLISASILYGWKYKDGLLSPIKSPKGIGIPFLKNIIDPMEIKIKTVTIKKGFSVGVRIVR